MIKNESIYNFTDAVDYLNCTFELRRIKNNRYSLRAWARQLGYENPSFLSHILKRKRKLKINITEKFASNLQLSDEGKRYFELLVLLQNSSTMEEKKIYLDLIESLRPKTNRIPKTLNIEAFRFISDWYHTAILEMVELREFKNDPEYISKRLSGNISVHNIKKAIIRLLKLKLLEETPSRKLKRTKGNPVIIESYIPSEALRYFHKQMIEKAHAAIEEQSLKERDIRGSMISIHMNDYSKIQAIIKKAHSDIVKYSSDGNGDEIYHFNTQFFKVTK